MYEPLRIAAAVEGPTDAIMLRAILRALLPDDVDFVFQTLQPERSAAFGSASFGATGAGWVGVFRWSRQSAQEGGGSVSGCSALSFHDVLIVHVDADVAGKTYASGGIQDAPCDDLPCEEPCPPPERTTNNLRAVVLNWLGERGCPPRTVLCTPSKNTEAWVLAAMWPENEIVQQDDWECRANPEGQLAALPKRRRFKKSPDDYRRMKDELTKAWPSVSARLTEAARFEAELLPLVLAAGRVEEMPRWSQP